MATAVRPSQKNDALDKHHAALRGALSAVSGSCARAATGSTRARPITPQPPPKRPQLLSHASSAAILAHRQSKAPEAKETRFQGPQSPATTSQQAGLQVAIPSNVAASLAFARHSPRKDGLTPDQKRRAITSADGNAEDILPPTDTVKDVKKWLQTLESGQGGLPSGQTRGSTSGSARSRAPSAELNPKPCLERPSISIDVPKSNAGDNSAADSGRDNPVSDIHSPKPIRPASMTSGSFVNSRSVPMPRDPRGEMQLATTRDGPFAKQSIQDMRTARLTSPGPKEDPSQHRANGDLGTTGARQPLPSLKPKPAPPPPRRSQGQIHDSHAPELNDASRFGRGPEPGSIGSMILHANSSHPSIDRQARDIAAARRSQTPNLGTPTNEPFLTKKVSPHMTGDSLANAIVASSLASSCAPSPTRSPAPPLPHRPTDKSRFSLHQFRAKSQSRAASPTKGMRQTMRKQASVSEEDLACHRRGRKPRIRKHPNKHHEGDRKRWRDEITALERKRYEGVWAANRGLLVQDQAAVGGRAVDANNDVCNLVVRDIWRRSRLHDHILEEVWNLVDEKRIGSLGRAEFVVGLWLVDQRLKGRKLPVKVSSSIWLSARGIQGLQIPKYKHG